MSISKRIVAASRKVGYAVRARVTRQRHTTTTATATAQPIDAASASSGSVETAVDYGTSAAESHKDTAGSDEVISMLMALQSEVREIRAWMGVAAATSIVQSLKQAAATAEAVVGTAATEPTVTEDAAARVKARETAVEAHERDVAVREVAVEAREVAVAECVTDAKTRERDVQFAVAAFSVREAKIAKGEGAVKKREDDVKKDEAAIEARNAALEERETSLETREDNIEERESEVKEREAALEEREAALDEREIAIEEQATAFEQCEDAAAEYDEPDTDVAMVEGIDRAIDHAELQQESLNIGIALAEARHKASLLVIARAELCEETAIANNSIGTHILVDIVRVTSRFKVHTETLGNDIRLAIKRLEALFEAIACAESCREIAFSEPATGADAIHKIYSAIACAEASREALDSGVVVTTDASNAVQRAIACIEEHARAAFVVKPVTAHAEHHTGTTMTVDCARGIAEELRVHMKASDDNEEVAAATNVLERLDGAISLVGANFGSVATLEVATTRAKWHLDIVTALNHAADITNLLQARKELDPGCGFARIVDSLDCAANIGGEYLMAVAAGDDIEDGAGVLAALENAIAGVERHL
ncbi:hypothetical protein GGI01_001598 [Coemansia sp. RSA 376]|nr:hypothetical protein GGI01_001598 [Coemansia sp. RSA 376]